MKLIIADIDGIETMEGKGERKKKKEAGKKGSNYNDTITQLGYIKHVNHFCMVFGRMI